ncbi:ubiquinol-cytochrome C reductase complex 14kD subunit-domain-containing protein [Nemania sp. FL0916]|nr:ubiquinol-cytochrome C reductase complex 14kD subunit-domain-containing protein [Nemania sp. FL0916]
MISPVPEPQRAAVQGAILCCKPAPTTHAHLTAQLSSHHQHQPTIKQYRSPAMASLAPFIMKRPWLHNMLMPVANWYCNAAGYRQLGLRFDDLIIEENEQVLAALKRLPPQEAYDRVYRLRRALQCSVSHKLLPKEQWTKPEEDIRYLTPILEQLRAVEAEKEALDSLSVVRHH